MTEETWCKYRKDYIEVQKFYGVRLNSTNHIDRSRPIHDHNAHMKNAYHEYMQTQEKLADFIFGGLEKAIMKLKNS